MNEGIKIKYRINRSCFIGCSEICNNKEDLNEIVKQYKKKYRDAKQICYAIISEGIEIYNDDKEPNGTAGAMILKELKKNNIKNILIIIVRYFGGIKLGKNNLKNTYAEIASKIIDSINSNIKNNNENNK